MWDAYFKGEDKPFCIGYKTKKALEREIRSLKQWDIPYDAEIVIVERSEEPNKG
jgi:hypothetical protein